MLLLLLLTLNASATPIFQQTPGGEVVTDLSDKHFGSAPNFVWANDPFLKIPGLREREPASENFTVQAVAPDGGSAFAVVENRVVKQGQKVRNRVVRKVGENHVVLESETGSLLEVPFKAGTTANAGAGNNGPTPASVSSGPSSIQIEEVKP